MPRVIWVSFIMDKTLAPACKVYHAHCKEVKDWVVFAGNVVTTLGPNISLHYCVGRGNCITGLEGSGIKTVGGKAADNALTHQQRLENSV